MTLSPGTRLGPYEIISPLGAGGMGEVYRARDTKLNRDVALKILPDAFAADADRLARFKREAQVLASLNHPNIAQIYGFEDSNATHALALELVDGLTLGDRIAQGPIPLADALPIAKQIAEALDAAHQQGIIHRDLKPANVKVRDDGTVKVLDFGLAKALHDEASAAADAPTMTSPTLMTHQGVILGTAAYMAPEQARGKAVDKRADIWAFGCVLYEMLTGRRPFAGDDVTLLLAAIMRDAPDMAQVPPHARRLIAKCLEKDPPLRLRDLGDAWELLSDDSTLSTRPPSRSDRERVVLGATGLVLTVLSAGTAWFLKPSAKAPSTVTARFPVDLPSAQQITNTGRHLVAMAPDGSAFVYVATNRLFLRRLNERASTLIPGTDIAQGVLNPVFSPDSRSVAFYSMADHTIKRVAIGGGTAITIGSSEPPLGMSWTPDDSLLVGQGGNGVVRVSAGGGRAETIVTVKATESAHGPQLLPGGRWILFTLATTPGSWAPAAPASGWSARWDNAQIVVQSLKTGERKILVEGGRDARYVPSGHLLYARGGALLAVPFDVNRLTIAGNPVSVMEGVRGPGGNTGAAQFSVSENGSLVYLPADSTSAGVRTLALVDRNGRTSAIGLAPGDYRFPRVSPNGRYLTFDVSNDNGLGRAVWVYGLDGKSSPRKLTFNGSSWGPIWSADSQRVLYTTNREAPSGLFWQRADGTGVAERVTRPDPGWPDHRADAWAPGGQAFLFTVENPINDADVWIYSFADKRATKLVDGASWQENAVFSPDGRWVAYQSWETTVSEIYVQPVPPTGAKFLISKSGGNHPVWSADGKEVVFMNNAANGQLYSISVRTEPSFTFADPVALPVQGFIQSPDFVRNFDVTPDGKQFVVILPSTAGAKGDRQALHVEVVLNWFDELRRLVPVK